MRGLYSGIRGTEDFSPPQARLFNKVTEKSREVFYLFGYQEIILPLLEEAGLFIRGVGKDTEIVEKQMFKVIRRIGQEKREVVLRPEGTAQVVRFYLEEALYKQSGFHKFFYIGPMFRGEKPQKGRLRQFTHIGAEAIGSASFYVDAELIRLAWTILEEIGLKEKTLIINTLGCLSDKKRFSQELGKTLQGKRGQLCADCRRRAENNPLRVLDCKKESCRAIVSSLPLGEVGVCSLCRKQFQELLSLLGDLGLRYVYQPTLVRGLDYYTHTVFEITSPALGSQNAFGAGGRYNNLIKDLGGPDIPAAGFALGIERITLLLKSPALSQPIKLFIATASHSLEKEGFKILQQCREQEISSDMDYCRRSLKGQLRQAQKKGAKYVVILEEAARESNCVILKDMERAAQEKINRKDIVPVLKKFLARE